MLSKFSLLLFFLCAVMAGCTTVDISEKSFIRPDERPPAVEALEGGYTMEAVSVTHSDGVTSRGIYLRRPQARATVIYFGGNEFRIDREAKPVIEGLAKAGVDIVLFDHRGYGRSGGEPTAALLKTDAVALYRFVRAKAPPESKVVLYGLSLGSFIAASVAESQPIDGLVLEGAPTNVDEQVSSLIPWYVKPFVEVKVANELSAVDNVKALRDYSGPLLVLAGGEDEIVSRGMQLRLYESAKTTKKDMKVFPGYGHKGLVMSNGFPCVLREFLAKRVGA